MKTIKISLTVLAIFFTINSYAQFKILSNGNVGINDDTPSAKLDITSSSNSKGFSLNTYNTYNYQNSIEVRNKNNAETQNWVVYYGPTSTTKRFCVNALGYCFAYYQFVTSDERIKRNIETINSPLEKVLKLRGVRFQYSLEEEENLPLRYQNKSHYGLIAQEVEEIVPEVVTTMDDGMKAVAYQNLVGLLIEAIKEQQREIEKLNMEIDGLKNNLKKSTSINNSSKSNAKLFQNNPNPFSESTSISYYIPDDIYSAEILIFNMQGLQQKAIKISKEGNGEVVINGGEFKPGMYVYTMIVNGNVIDTKNMILTK